MEPSTQKEIFLVTFACLLNIITFFLTALTIAQMPSSSWLIITTVIAMIGWLLIMNLALFFVSRKVSIIVLFTVMASAIIVSGGMFEPGAIGGAILALLGAITARRALQHDKENRIVHRVRDVFSSGSRLLVMAFLLGVAGLSLPYVNNSIQEEGIKISPQQVSLVLKPLTPFLKNVSPNLDPSSTMDDLINQQVKDQGLDPSQLSDNQRDALRQSLGSQMGITVTGQETLIDVVTQRVNSTLQNITRNNSLIVTLVLIILVFIAIRSAVPIAVWLLLPLISLFIWLGQRTSIFTRHKTTVEIDHLKL